MTKMLNKNKHQVAQWKWETTLDDREMAHSLQNLLSDWSQSSLKKELNRGLNIFCPTDHIWRIQKLELDLGELEYGDLERELPQRFRESLKEALQRLVLHHESPHENIAELVTPPQSNREALHCFLRQGTVPWWFARNNISLKQLLETLLREQPEELASLLRETGKSEMVRKRVVWQFGGPLVRKIIKVLEPHHCKTILDFADHLVEVREEEGWDGKELEQYRWLWILKHLLVDRGTLFNTVMFVKQTIRQMAHYYQMDYELLLSVLIGASQETKGKNLIVPVFLNALREIGREEKKERAQPVSSRLADDPLMALERFLLTGESPRYEISPKKLLESLLLEQPEELVSLLRETGKKEEARKRMVWQWGGPLVKKIVKALEPSHCKTILDFADHLIEVRDEEGWDGKQLEQHRWLWILKHLFVERGTLFNTVMYMKQTILQMAHYYQMDYELLLGVIIGAARETSRNNQLVPVFLSALLEIDRDREKEAPTVEGTSSPEYLWIILERLLQKGQSHEAISGEQVQTGELFLELARQFPRQMAEFLPMVGRESRTLRHIVNQFSERELACVVKLTAPENHLWILTHIRQTMEGLARYNKGALQKKQKALVWEVTLSYLFQDRGSYFNRREFIKNVLVGICKKENIQYRTFLSILSCADYPAGGMLICHTELLSIFLDLLQEEEKRAPLLKETDEGLWRDLDMILMGDKENTQGKGTSLSPGELFSLLLRQSPDRVIGVLVRVNAEGTSRLPHRLLKIVHFRDLPFLVRCLSSGLADLAFLFLARFRSWNADRPLECLHGVDLPAALHEALFYTLLGQRGKGLSPEAFVEALLKRPIKTHSIHPEQWNAELSARLRESGTLNREEKLIALALSKGPQKSREFIQKKHSKKGGEKGVLPKQPKKLTALCVHWLHKGRPPSSFSGRGKMGLETVMRELLAKQPQLFPRLLQTIQNDNSAMARLFNALEFEALVRALLSAHPELRVTCSALQALHRIGYKLGIRGVHSSEFSRMLLELVLESWRTSAWERLTPGRIWQEMTWLMVLSHRVSSEAMEDSFQEWKHLLPPGVQLGQKLRPSQTKKNVPDIPKQQEQDSTGPIIEDAITVSNAGLVILQQYIPLYLERLQLIKKEDKSFVSAEAGRKAVHYLQFLATGQRETEESHLALNKVICGLPLSGPLEAGIDMTPAEVELGEGLIKAMFNLWSAVGTTSLQGFRGNWFVRQGALREKEDQWDLTVEKKAYDLLLNQAPFTFSIIKFSWMEKPIHVTWTY